MNILFILSGIAFVIIGVLGTLQSTAKKAGPKSNDKRIVVSPDGTSHIEIYSNYPCWSPMITKTSSLEHYEECLKRCGFDYTVERLEK